MFGLRRSGFTLVEILVALGLGSFLLGVGFLLAGQISRVTQEGVTLNRAVSSQAGGVDILGRELEGVRILGIERGDSQSFVAYVLRGEVTASLSVQGRNVELISLPGVRAGDPLFLQGKGVIPFTEVASVSSGRVRIGFLDPDCNSNITDILGPSGTSIKVYLLEKVTFEILRNPSKLRVQRADGTSYESNPLPGTFSFAYTYRSPTSSTEVSFDRTGPKPGLVQTVEGQSYLLSGIVIGASNTENTLGTLARIPVEALGSGRCTWSQSSPSASGVLMIRIEGPDGFFNALYNNAPDGDRVRVVERTTTVLRTVGDHTVTVSAPGRVVAGTIRGRETVSGLNIEYIYTPDPSERSFNLNSQAPINVPVIYTVEGGTLRINVITLPQGASWSATYTGNGRYAMGGSIPSTTETQRILTLPPGVYNFTFTKASLPGSATLGGTTVNFVRRYSLASATPRPVGVSSQRESSMEVRYNTTPDRGTLRVTVTGLPSGASAIYRLRDESGTTVLSRTAANGTYTESLLPGGYEVVAERVQIGGVWYDPSVSVRVVGLSSDEETQVTISYSAPPGTLDLKMTGLPEGQGNIWVQGPSGYRGSFTGSTTLRLTTFGTYTVTAGDVVYNGRIYTATVSPGSLYVQPGGNYTVNVNYRPITIIRLTFDNNTRGMCSNGTVRIARESSPVYTASADAAWRDIPPGTYTASFITAPSSSFFTCSGDVFPTSTALNEGDQSTFIARIRATDGALRVRLVGYPYSTLGPGHITVRSSTGTVLSNPPLSGGTLTYSRLTPGTYTVSASTFTEGTSGFQYVPSPTSITANVRAGEITEVTITYGTQTAGNTVGLRVTVECPTCTSQQRQNAKPLVCLYLGTGTSFSVPKLPLVDCPNATSR